MSPLRGPLEQHLAPAIDDAQIQKVAQELKAARRAPPRRPWGLVFVAAAVAVVLAVVGVRTFMRPAEPRALALASGAALPAELSGRTTLDDLSVVDGAPVQVVASTPSQLTLLLRAGRTRFEVTPGGPRKWLVEAGLVTVEVVGTVFTVERGDDGVQVSVERGTVIVRGDTLPDRLVRLDAGMSVKAGKEPPSPLVGVRGDSSEAPNSPLTPTLSPTRGEGARRLTAEQLLQRSDDARANGDDAAAAKALLELLQLYPNDPTAASAAFTLGRLELEKLNRPADAAKHFALAASSPPLANDARVRHVEALAAAGDQAEAEAAARSAIEQAPGTAQAARLQRWLDDPQHAPTWLR